MSTLLTREQVAERLAVSAHLAGTLMKQMSQVRVGGRYRVTEQALEAWIQQQTQHPASIPGRKTLPKSSRNYLTEDGRIPKRRELREMEKTRRAS